MSEFVIVLPASVETGSSGLTMEWPDLFHWDNPNVPVGGFGIMSTGRIDQARRFGNRDDASRCLAGLNEHWRKNAEIREIAP